MTTTNQSDHSQRSALLEQIAAITTMQNGTLAEEWRQRPGPDGKTTIQTGPYYKYQVWKDGRNCSRRVPPSEASQLREDTENAKRFEQLTAQLAELNIQHTVALRAAQAQGAENQESKKTLGRSNRREICRNRSLHHQSKSGTNNQRTRPEP